ncbi:DUF1232 domain-containing protein [Paenibacillus sp. HN-1]|nr:DUF1232 domain-containing protein [Paenibacillus sp. CGMCC 1.18879]MBY9087387.1 DUF1232 domain-containing protein [Paenibacillus sinensis]
MDRISDASCGHCGHSLLGEEQPSSPEPDLGLEAVLASADAADGPHRALPDTGKWLSRIGGSDKQEEYVKKGFLRKAKKHAASLPFIKEAVAMYYCAMDKNTPLTAKLIAIGALAYLVLPIDAIPDLIPVLGYTDDAAAFWAAYRSISAHVTDLHREQAQAWLESS